jgi:hypothetical protein
MKNGERRMEGANDGHVFFHNPMFVALFEHWTFSFHHQIGTLLYSFSILPFLFGPLFE